MNPRRSRTRWWAWPSELAKRGVLGMNSRNLDLLMRYNPRTGYSRLDDKLQTKAICQAVGIAVPRTYAVVETHRDLGALDGSLRQPGGFVAKPAQGSGGRGIVVVERRDGRAFVTTSGDRLSGEDLTHHLAGILSGLYSFGGRGARALIEERIGVHERFREAAVGGTPDIRVVVFACVPVMAMLRLPTRASGGRANLHQGAVGVGVDMATGRTFGGVCGGRAVRRHPDTDAAVGGIAVPGWENVLETAAKAGRALEMGYIGVDLVLDAAGHPVVLEANVRPGLGIQLANGAGLWESIRRIRPPQPGVAGAPPPSQTG